MFSNVQLKFKMATGFALLALVIVAIGSTGLRSLSMLSSDLSYILGSAWEAADGAMESSIEIEAQMIAINDILQENNPTQAKMRLDAAKSNGAEALQRMSASGLIPTTDVQSLNQNYQRYSASMDKLLTQFELFQQAHKAFHDNAEQIVMLGEEMEELGDQAMEVLESNLDSPLYWKQDLEHRWLAADGGMEANIGLLRQMYHLQRLLSGHDLEQNRAEIQQAMNFQKEAIDGMFSTGQFDVPAGEAYRNQTFNEAYTALINRHETRTAAVITAYEQYQLAATNYQQDAQRLLDSLVAVEEIADSTVENKASSSEATRQSATFGMWLALLIGLVLAIAFGSLLHHIVMSGIQQLKDRIDDVVEGGGDLTRRLNLKQEDEFGKLAQSLDQFMEQMNQLVRDVAASSPQIQASTQELLTTAQNTSQGMEHQRKQTDQISAAVFDMDETARYVAESIESASRQAHQVDEETQHVYQVLNETNSSVNKLGSQIASNSAIISSLNESVNNINTVLEVITGIAEQTNLLALNAAIEAARAGEQGRGFAVVADEVRGLAARTQDSTGEIRRMIDDLRNKATEAVDSMHASSSISEQSTSKATEAMESLDRIRELVSALSMVNVQVASSAKQQFETTRSLSTNISSIQEIAQSTCSQMEQTLDLGSRLQSIGGVLNQQVGRFKI